MGDSEMSRLEKLVVIIGFITLFLDSVEMRGGFTEKETLAVILRMIVGKLISGLMILLPLYFRLWR